MLTRKQQELMAAAEQAQKKGGARQTTLFGVPTSFRETAQSIAGAGSVKNLKRKQAGHLGAYHMLGVQNQKSSGKSVKSKKVSRGGSNKSKKPVDTRSPGAHTSQQRVESSGNGSVNVLDRAAIQETEGNTCASKNQIYNLEGDDQPAHVTDEGSMLNIRVPLREDQSEIGKLVRRISPERCGVCDLERGLAQLDRLLSNQHSRGYL